MHSIRQSEVKNQQIEISVTESRIQRFRYKEGQANKVTKNTANNAQNRRPEMWFSIQHMYSAPFTLMPLIKIQWIQFPPEVT